MCVIWNENNSVAKEKNSWLSVIACVEIRTENHIQSKKGGEKFTWKTLLIRESWFRYDWIKWSKWKLIHVTL